MAENDNFLKDAAGSGWLIRVEVGGNGPRLFQVVEIDSVAGAPQYRLEARPEACGVCQKDPAAGYAAIDDIRYCHGDNDEEPTCYMRASNPFYAVSERLAVELP